MDPEKTSANARREGRAQTDESVQASIERLVASGKELAEAELAWARLKGWAVLMIVRRGARYSAAAMACLTVGLSLLLVALVVALIPLVGLLFALLIVSAVAFAGMAVFGLLARRSFRQLYEGDVP